MGRKSNRQRGDLIRRLRQLPGSVGTTTPVMRDRRLRLRLIAVSTMLMLGILTIPKSALAEAGKPGDAQVSVSTACFTVNNPGDPLPTTLYGLRYTTGEPTSRTPAIVLVHGVASSTANWDFLPSWSVARSLASHGFVVISYDRLGFDKSVYNRPQGGRLATITNQRDILHQVIGEVKSGGYAVATGIQTSCGGVTRPSRLANPTVAIAGHSAGGAIVQGYPGKYPGDVVAMIQANWANKGPQSPAVTHQLDTVVIPDLVSGKDYVRFFANSQECEDFNLYDPGKYNPVAEIACDASKFVLTPAGEFTNFPLLQQENDQYEKTTGSTPVLLTYGDHDAAFPPANAQQDYAAWTANCPACDITPYFEQKSGHLFMAHRLLLEQVNGVKSWIDEVVGWLASKHVTGRAG